MHDRPEDRACSSCGSTRGLRPLLTQKTASAYVVVRAVRLLQAHDALPWHGGAEVRGVHVHHLVYGGLLVVAQHAASARYAVCLHQPVRSNVFCTGAALMLDEFDVITRTEGRLGSRAARAVLDLLALSLLACTVRSRRRTLQS